MLLIPYHRVCVHVLGYTYVYMYVKVRGEPQISLRYSLTFNKLLGDTASLTHVGLSNKRG